ncbi:DUF4892 domain-containing protein [Thalassolituus sp. C2-1]|uniref:DUF4892 domain-containing protein n=1 Tax=Venatorbacter sp. C2-1 TaxID=2597518 RepID=UPI0011940E0B|nr:DUF4892 domain-containing protein [Thalassolituus sp. C2-1]TVV42167.1 DUF4892 domain-containing protein [Thalassolituus sp. C2-1]
MRWLVLLTGLLVSPLWALDAFPQAGLLEDKTQDVSNYRLVISELKRNQATTYGEHERRLKGTLWRRVWAVEDRVPLDTVINHYAQQLNDSRVIYQCRALDCGSNPFWANEIFHNARLGGREQNQFYMVALKEQEGSKEKKLYVLYVIERGSKQVMVNLDVLTTRDAVQERADMNVLIQQALVSSHGWLPGLVVENGQINEQQSSALIAYLKNLTPGMKRRLYLLVHCYDASHMNDNIQCSERLAEQLQQATFDGQYELNIDGHGALTPAPDNSLQPALRFIFWPGR